MTRRTLLRLAPVAALFCLVLMGGPAAAQSVNIDLGGDGSGLTQRIVELVALITVLSLAPSALMMVTSFVRIVIVLSLLRTALGLQQSPPNAVMISLALFLTAFIMSPVFQKSYNDGIAPFVAEQIEIKDAFPKAVQPFKDFMLAHVRETDLELFINMAGDPKPKSAAETPLPTIVPAFLISELRRAFEIGFLLFIPFLIIDMVVASVLMSMGMMMLPPVIISLPFKLIFFVLVDGWHLVAGSLVQSFATK